MAKKKVQAPCVDCGTVDGLFIDVGNGLKLPSYSFVIGKGVVCYPCKDKAKVGV